MDQDNLQCLVRRLENDVALLRDKVSQLEARLSPSARDCYQSLSGSAIGYREFPPFDEERANWLRDLREHEIAEPYPRMITNNYGSFEVTNDILRDSLCDQFGPSFRWDGRPYCGPPTPAGG